MFRHAVMSDLAVAGIGTHFRSLLTMKLAPGNAASTALSARRARAVIG